MNQFKISLVNLVLGLAIFFNVERLDFGQRNFIDIQTFVYPLGMAAVVSLLLWPRLARASASLSLTFWLGTFLVCKLLFFNDRPVLGGVFTYLTVTEVGLVGLLVVLAHRVGGGLEDFLEAVKCITLERVGQQVVQVEAAGEVVRAEMTRSRHYQRPLSVIVAVPKSEEMQSALPALVREAEEAFVHRYASARMASLIRKELRLMDTVLEDRKNRRFIILCPEINGQNSTVLIDRIRTAVEKELGIEVQCAAASFPDKALTFEELVSQAQVQLQQETRQKSALNQTTLYPNAQG